jgi:hypothetical protein
VDAPLEGFGWQGLGFSKVTVMTGKAAGRSTYISAVHGKSLLGFGETCPQLFDGVEVGDEVHLDNHNFIAYAHLYLYALNVDTHSISVEGHTAFAPEHAGLRAQCIDHRPIYPQRAGPRLSRREHTGKFEPKMIQILTTHDSRCWPGPSAFYSRKVREHLGDKADERYRLWFVENSPHTVPEIVGLTIVHEGADLWNSRLVDYEGVTAAALRAVTAWAEDGVAPPPNTRYELTEDAGVVLDPSAERRGGVQPLAWATANGGARAEVRVGEPVTFEGRAQMPPGAGTVVEAEWDFAGDNRFVAQPGVDGAAAGIALRATHAYDRPGTYFASFRVGGHQQGKEGVGPPARNNARVRVVVSP